MKTKTLLLTVSILLFSTFILKAQNFDKNREDSLLNLLETNNKAMGSIAVLDNGNIIYAKAIGFKESYPSIMSSDEKTKYRIGSISKMFTATLIFNSIDEGKLELETSLARFFPAVPNADKITVEMLLSHRSGIHNFTEDSFYLTYMLQPKTRNEMADIITATKPDFKPDSITRYSNSNFLLLGYILEDLYNKTYNEILQEHICKKAGLNDTYYGGRIDPAQNESHSFRLNQLYNGNVRMDSSVWEKLPETDMSIPHGAGAIISTPVDLVKFIYALFNCQLISETSLSNMLIIKDGTLGLGIMKFPYENKIVYGHGGAIDGFNSILCYIPEDKIAFSYISNGTSYAVNNILLSTINNYYGKYDKLPEFKTYAVIPEELEQYTGVYASVQIPIKVTVTTRDGKLYCQGSGQPEILLEPADKNIFKFDPAGIIMNFHPEQKEFILEQGGGKFTFTRE